MDTTETNSEAAARPSADASRTSCPSCKSTYRTHRLATESDHGNVVICRDTWHDDGTAAARPTSADNEREGHCPTCDSPSPERHPAIAFEGEVSVCPHPYHSSTERGREVLERVRREDAHAARVRAESQTAAARELEQAVAAAAARPASADNIPTASMPPAPTPTPAIASNSERKRIRARMFQVLRDAGFTADEIIPIENAAAVSDMLMMLAGKANASADPTQPKNYVAMTFDGMKLPFDRANIELVRPGGKTPAEKYEELETSVVRFARYLRNLGIPTGDLRAAARFAWNGELSAAMLACIRPLSEPAPRPSGDSLRPEVSEPAPRPTSGDNSTVTPADPIPMILFCPACHERHIDVTLANKPHHTHACQACGMVWRPAKVATAGVQFLPGYKDERAPANLAEGTRATTTQIRQAMELAAEHGGPPDPNAADHVERFGAWCWSYYKATEGFHYDRFLLERLTAASMGVSDKQDKFWISIYPNGPIVFQASSLLGKHRGETIASRADIPRRVLAVATDMGIGNLADLRGAVDHMLEAMA